MISLPQELFEKILFYVPQDLNSIDRETQKKVNEAFNYLFQSYMASPSIRRFMPHQRNLSKQIVVLQTASDIFRFGSLIRQPVSGNFSSDHLHSILEDAEKYLETLGLNTIISRLEYWSPLASNASRAGNVQDLRILHAMGELNGLISYQVVRIACICGYLPIIRELLARGTLNQHLREMGVVHASTHRHLPLVQALLESGEISAASCHEAIARARRNNDLATLAILVKSLRIPPVEFGGAAVCTALCTALCTAQRMIPRSAIVVLIIAVVIFQILSTNESFRRA